MNTTLTILPAPEIPKTGDTSAPVLWLALVLLGLLGLSIGGKAFTNRRK